MRTLTKWVFLLTVVVTGWSLAQQPTAILPAEKADAGKRSLEDLLASALKHSPDVQVAQAKVKEAEAELRKVRLTLLQKVVEGNALVEAQRASVAHTESAYRRVVALVKTGNVPHEEVEKAEAQLAGAKATLAQAEATLNSLTGTLPKGVSLMAGVGPDASAVAITGAQDVSAPGPILGGGAGVGMGTVAFGGGLGALGGGPPDGPAPRMPHGPMAEKLRTALDTNIKLSPVRDKPLGELLAGFRSNAAGVPFLVNLGEKANQPVTLSLEGDVALGAAFQALQDVVPGLLCYVREYGVLATVEEAPQPADGMPLIEFWQRKK
jgi:hypothetical protein